MSTQTLDTKLSLLNNIVEGMQAPLETKVFVYDGEMKSSSSAKIVFVRREDQMIGLCQFGGEVSFNSFNYQGIGVQLTSDGGNTKIYSLSDRGQFCYKPGNYSIQFVKFP